MTRNNSYESYRIPVPAEYWDVFSHFYYARNGSKEIITKTLLPSYQSMMIFNLGARAIIHSEETPSFKMDPYLVLGPVRKAVSYSLVPGSEIFVVNFKEGSFYRFFGRSSSSNSVLIEPYQLMPEDCFLELWSGLDKLVEISLKVKYFLAFCKPYLRDQDTTAKQLIDFKNGSFDPVKSIASNLGQTRRNIQIRHKKYLGYSFKEILRFRRFVKAIEMVDKDTSKSKIDWFSIIHECGYYDQSQLIRDFKRFLNLTPTQYLKFKDRICNPLT